MNSRNHCQVEAEVRAPSSQSEPFRPGYKYKMLMEILHLSKKSTTLYITVQTSFAIKLRNEV